MLSLLLLLGGAACTPDDPAVSGDELPVSDLNALLDGTPEDRGMSLAFDAKADETLPPEFDLIEYQTPIRNQGSRGTCTIFASTALMESLYTREGTMENVDFSEQFLQWSVKFEVNSFPNSSGSNARYNLQSINRHGIVLDELWPYESRQWGVSNDADCAGEGQPIRCFTNGQPPEAALAAERFTLPQGRWINPSERSIKGHMVSTRTPVVVGVPFFYQSWNHGGSSLPVDRDRGHNFGYILAPNDADVTDSRLRPAGHGFLLVGYDDELEVQALDGEGNPMVDEAGEPVVQRGFFLFKNSWGSDWAVQNPHGAGYGWISYEYIREHGTAYTSGVPTITRVEICNDHMDNDLDGRVDCEDSDCSADRSCMDPVDEYTNNTVTPIPDNDPTGITSSVTIVEGGTISSVAVTVDITHTYRGDLSVALISANGTRVELLSRQGGSEDDVQQTFTTAALNGNDAAGDYTLLVSDHGRADTGTLNSWTLDITRCTTDCAGSAMERTFADGATGAIADNDTTAYGLDLSGVEGGDTEITSLAVTVDIDHSFPYELTIRLAREGGREFVLLTEDTSSDSGVQRTFSVPGFVGADLASNWTLSIVDAAAGDTGTLNSWSLQASTR